MGLKMLALLLTLAVQAPQDSDEARQAAIARLRAGTGRTVCGDSSTASQVYGTTCASREFPAPPILDAPAIRWQVSHGWWAVWSPLLIDGKILTGSCNNNDNKGLSALSTSDGKILWRIGSVCDEGSRAGSMGRARFYELDPQTVLFTLSRDDGKPDDHYIVDVKAGKILRTLTPVKRGIWAALDGVFAVITFSTPDKTTYLNGLNSNLDTIAWRHDTFRLKCDKLDPHCEPVFTPGAGDAGVFFFSATSKDQAEPPTRQLHAFDAKTGRLLWRHTAQPEYSTLHTPGYRSDDGAPMVAGGKVIIRLGRYLGSGRAGRALSLRALDAKTGAVVWTTEPVRLPEGFDRGVTLVNRISVGDVVVAEFAGREHKEIAGYRLEDGKQAWRRAVPMNAVLTASSGGVFYVAENVRTDTEQVIVLKGFDGQTGTLLWTARLPGHNVPFIGEWGIDAVPSTLQQGPSWRIARDGAIYGVTMTGAYKLK